MLLLSIIKALIEVAGMSIIAQGIVGLFNPSGRENNPIYQLFGILTNPIHKIVRKITPKQVVDQHVPMVSFFFLLVLWLMITGFRIYEYSAVKAV
jgi:uncharacterized protein YggT (Ycf19 family)